MAEKANRAKVGAAAKTAMVVAGFLLGWVGIELAFRPFLAAARSTIDRSLNPERDPDDDDELLKTPIDTSNEQQIGVAVGDKEEEEEDSKASSKAFS